MTTIAYRDGIIAADSQVTLRDLNLGRQQKISTAGDYILAHAGELWTFAGLVEWLTKHDANPAKFPANLSNKENDGNQVFSTLVLHKENLFIIESGTLMPMNVPFHAIGSGCELALGAMAAGAGALEAVRTACQLCVYSSGPFSQYDAKTGKLTNDIA